MAGNIGLFIIIEIFVFNIDFLIGIFFEKILTNSIAELTVH